jgi:hypothetical protein
LRDDGDGVHFDQEIGVSQGSHKRHGDGGRVWTATPDTLEDCKAGLQGLTLDDVEVPLDYVLQAGAGGFEGDLEVVQDLLGLGGQVALADDGAGGVEGVLPADVDGLDRAGDGDELREGGVVGEAGGVEVFDLRSGHGWMAPVLRTIVH